MRKRFNPEIFLKIAKDLRDNDDLHQEGRYRSAIGRAYYAAFLTVRNKLKLKGKTFNKNKQPKEVRNYLKILNHNFIANQLETLFDNRVKADYKLKSELNQRICNKCIIISEEIIHSTEGM